MDLIFVCRQMPEVFKSSNFEIIDNKGIKTDADGNKFLDAKILLNDPCPICGEIHVYHASELTCPFNG